MCIAASILDEDDGEDEIYVSVRLVGNGRTLSLRTNEISHSF